MAPIVVVKFKEVIIIYTVQPALYVVDTSVYPKHMCVVSECLCVPHIQPSVFWQEPHMCVVKIVL